MSIAVATAVGVAVSLVVTRIVEIAARRTRLLDVPNERSSHEVPTPRIGGLGIIAGTLMALALSGALADDRIVAVLGAAVLAAGVGLIDDLRRTSVRAKLAGQVVPAIGVVIVLDPSLAILPEWATWAMAVAWIVAVCNVVNFMDGTDGLVATYVSVVSMALWLILGGSTLFVALGAGCLGFLVWNRAPASIFMGDTGSHFIGFMLGAGLLADREPALLPLGILVLAPLLLDVAITLVRRLLAGRNVFQAHREHVYQRLADRWGHGLVSLVYGSAGLACALAAYALSRSWP